MDKPLFSPTHPLPQMTMKSLEHEQEKPHLSSVKVSPSDVGQEKSSFELALFCCICLLQVFDMLCMFIGVVCWCKSFVVSKKLVSVWISVLYLRAWLTTAVLFSAAWLPREFHLCQRVCCRTVPSFTGELATLKRGEKSFYVHIFLHFSPQSLEDKVMEMSLFWWRGMRLSQVSET